MTDRGNFLERWSRRKIEAGRQAADDAREQGAAPAQNEGQEDKATVSAGDAPAQPARRDQTPAPSDAKPAFDIASLPSLESITASTDVRAFLAPGVPTELTRAALRRAWTADPAIRSFKGLAENDWDFTDPNAMAGFTDLPADFDIKKVIAQILGENDDAAGQPTAAEPDRAVPPVQPSDQPRKIASADDVQPVAAKDAAAPEAEQPGPPTAIEARFVQRNDDSAAHNSGSIDEKDEAKTRRTHGRALPQ